MEKALRTKWTGAIWIALGALVFAGACGRGAPEKSAASDGALAGEVTPGMIDFELRGISAEHAALAKSLGEVLDDEAVSEGALEEIEPRSMKEEFFEVRTNDAAGALTRLQSHGDVLYAEREVQVHALFTPNDALYGKQWHLRAAGAERAWDAARGAGVTVAVLDTGVAQLDDLDASRLLPGFNFLTHSGAAGAASDDHFHGTHVAGTIAESTDNGVGGAGMAPLAKILPLKVLSASGSGSSAGIAEAIRYAADHGAQIINLSLGGGARSEAMERAVAYARRHGALVVAEAGNTGARGVSFPAAYPEALAVSAVGPSGALAPYSTYGAEVGIAAPGGDKSLGEEQGVLQQTLDDSSKPGYRFLQGTSMAAPHVSGAAALIASLGVTSPEAIERVLKSSASTPPRDGREGPRAERYGAGLLDAGAAVRKVTTYWGLARFALALLGAFVALGHARRLQQLRRGESMPLGFWAALALFSGALAIAAPLGFARLAGLSWLAIAPAAMPLRILGAPSVSALATLAAYLGFSAAAPLVLAGVSKLATREGQRGSSHRLGAIACGLAFGQAGLLLHTALVGSVHLPHLPPLAAAIWLLVNAVASWLVGRGLLARGRI